MAVLPAKSGNRADTIGLDDGLFDSIEIPASVLIHN
jgi:hypothetical protein